MLSQRFRAAPTTPRVVAFLVVIALALAVPPIIPNFWVFLLTAGAITTITAMGLGIVVGWIGEITLAGGALLGTSVYITGRLLRNATQDASGFFYDWNMIFAAAAGIACAAIISGAIAVVGARLTGIYMLVLTLAVQITLERSLFSQSWIAGGFGSNTIVDRPVLFGQGFEDDLSYFYLSFVVMLVACMIVWALRRSRHGRAMNLIRTDKRAAAAVGISPWKYKIIGFTISGALIGLAGALTAPLYGSPPALIQFLSLQSLFLLAIPVVSGTQSIFAIGLVAISFNLIPTALDDLGLSSFLLGGAGLLAGTLVGARGVGGAVLDFVQTQREAGILRRAGLARSTPPPVAAESQA